MKQLYTILALIAMIGTAAAAVYVITQSEATLDFTIDSQAPDTRPVISMFECEGGWSNSCSIGSVPERIVDKQIRHENTQAGMFEGVVYINIECEEGMMTSMGKMKDFVFIEFTDPYGDVYQCNDLACIEIENSAINTNLIKITPTNNTYSFDPMFDAYTNIRIGFVPTAYGDYRITAYVEASPAI
jgi:hypothetical protein